MSDFMTMFFGPLDKSSCVYFLIISILFFIGLVISLGAEALHILKNLKNINLRHLTNGLIILFNIFIAYFVNRLLYTMCTKSLA